MMPSTHSSLRAKRGFVLCALALAFSASALAQFDQDFGQMMRWRSIGPFRGGRTRALSGVPAQPNVFYIGAVNGGVWKTNDYGHTWKPIFDDQPTGSIGALAVAPSNPDIVYVGSGEGLHRPDLSVGDGIYKSTDAGKTWTHLGLRDGQQISADSRRSARSESPLRRRRRASLRAQSRARHLSLDRWRQDFREGPLQKREHRRRARRSRSVESQISSMPHCGKRAKARGRTAPGTAPAAASSSQPTAATPGNNLQGGLPDGIVQAYVAIAPSDPKRLVRFGRVQRNGGSIAPTTRGDLAHASPMTRGRRVGIGGGDLAGLQLDPKNPDTVYCRHTVTLELHRWRQDLDRLSRRAGRR